MNNIVIIIYEKIEIQRLYSFFKGTQPVNSRNTIET